MLSNEVSSIRPYELDHKALLRKFLFRLSLKLVSAIFYQIFVFHHMIAF